MIARNKAGTDNFSERKSLPTSLCSVCRMDFQILISGRWLLVFDCTQVFIDDVMNLNLEFFVNCQRLTVYVQPVILQRPKRDWKPF